MKRYLILLLALILFFAPKCDAAVAISEPVAEAYSTSNANSYALGSFTPAANAFLVVFVYASDTAAAGTMTDSGNSLTWTKRDSYTVTNTMYVFTAQAPASPAATVITFDCTGDTATGAAMHVFSVTGHSTSSPVRQTKGSDGTVADAAFTWTSAPLTASGLMAVVGVNRQVPAYSPPLISAGQDVDWTEVADGGYGSPNIGTEAAYAATGETLTSVNWTGAAGTWINMGIEINDAAVSGANGSEFQTMRAMGRY